MNLQDKKTLKIFDTFRHSYPYSEVVLDDLEEPVTLMKLTLEEDTFVVLEDLEEDRMLYLEKIILNQVSICYYPTHTVICRQGCCGTNVELEGEILSLDVSLEDLKEIKSALPGLKKSFPGRYFVRKPCEVTFHLLQFTQDEDILRYFSKNALVQR